MAATFEFTTELEIAADPDLVYEFFTDAELLARWHCVSAEVDPRPGGAFVLNITGEDVTRGEFLELEPGRRLVFSWGFAAVGETTVEVCFEAIPSGTRVRLRHFGFATPTAREDHRRGWAHYLPRLVSVAQGEDPGPDPWRKRRSAGG